MILFAFQSRIILALSHILLRVTEYASTSCNDISAMLVKLDDLEGIITLVFPLLLDDVGKIG